MEQFQTQDGHRPDLELALADINPYLGAIGTQIAPIAELPQKAGRIYYQVLQADAAAATNRVITAAPARTNIGETSATFSTTERIKGYTIPRGSVKTQFGTIERADVAGARAALRSVLRSHESSVADALIGGASAEIAVVAGEFVKSAKAGLKAVRRYRGPKALVVGLTRFWNIMDSAEIVARFNSSSAALAGQTAEDVIARNANALRMILASVIGLDQVLIGDDDIWGDVGEGYDDLAAIVALPDPSQDSEKVEPVFAKTLRYLPEGQAYPFRIESDYDFDTKLNAYDAILEDEVKVFNAGAAVVLTGLRSAVTTTTTSDS